MLYGVYSSRYTLWGIWLYIYIYIIIYIYIYIYISSSCHTNSTDITDPHSPPIPIVHRFRQVLRAASRIYTELLYVRAGSPVFARPYEGVHRITSLMSSSLLLQQCPACLVRLTWLVFVMSGRWPYSCFFGGCSLQDLFNIARSILV